METGKPIVPAPGERHSTLRDGRRLIWRCERLWELAAELEPFELALDEIAGLDQNCWFDEPPTLREVAQHAARIESADLDYPIILNADGSLMDGGHRVCRALLLGQDRIRAVRFERMPPPDQVVELDGGRG